MIWGQGDGSGLRAVDSAVRTHRLHHWRAGSTTIHWRDMRSWLTANRFTRQCIQVRSVATFFRSRLRPTSANMRWNWPASWLNNATRSAGCRPAGPHHGGHGLPGSARLPVAALRRSSRRRANRTGEPILSGEGAVIAGIWISLDRQAQTPDGPAGSLRSA